MNSSPEDDNTYIVIGIDFGTTYSGVPWVWSGDPDNFKQVTSWPTATNILADNAKAPTEISYVKPFDRRENDDTSRRDSPFAIQWGYSIPPGQSALKWFKLLLLNNDELDPKMRESERLRSANEALQRTGKDIIEVVADYLRLLWNLTVQDIENDPGGKALVDGFPFKVVLTVPVIWSAAANDKMIRAADLAGITATRSAGETTLSLAPEPEAAALATLSDLEYNARVGDIFVICDAGGGTADLISYKVDAVNPLRVSEYVGGKGKLCGGIFVDEGFKSYLRAHLSDRMLERLSSEDIQKLMTKEWEHGIKRLFDGSPRSWKVQLPPRIFQKGFLSRNSSNHKGRGIQDGDLILSSSSISSFFDRSCVPIKGLIAEQIKMVKQKSGKLPKGILLVGGFGSCQYLRKELLEEHAPEIQIHQSQGSRPWIAIARGALLKAMTMGDINSDQIAKVTSRISRINYGVTYYSTYNPRRHEENEKEWSEDECRWVVRDRLRWYLKC